jgi:hypothetical protein
MMITLSHSKCDGFVQNIINNIMEKRQRKPKLSRWWKTPSAKAAFKREEKRRKERIKKLREYQAKQQNKKKK